MKIEENRITAEEGRVLRRISDGMMVGAELHLGYTYYLHHKKLEVPLLELPEHYEEIDKPITEETVILDEDTEIVATEEELEVMEEEMRENPEPIKVTYSDFMNLKRELEEMKRVMGGG